MDFKYAEVNYDKIKSNLTDPFDSYFFPIEFIEINCQMIVDTKVIRMHDLIWNDR